jgi:hypothetical protein
MGRAGIEPATLGLKVGPNERKRAARGGTMLQLGHFLVAVSSSEMRPIETSVYAHSLIAERDNAGVFGVIRLVERRADRR